MLLPAAMGAALLISSAHAAPAESGRVTWRSTPEPAAGETMLDLRGLNDRQAGLHGVPRRKGARLVDRDGRDVRYWGVRLPVAAFGLAPAAMEHLARRLARSGVNLARLAPALSATPDDPAGGAGLVALTAALKQEGICTDLVLEADPGALFILPDAQARWRARAKTLLSLTGTGISGRLGVDPAVAFVEIDGGSVFGREFAAARVPELAWQKLENAFGDWSRSRYGTPEARRSAWLEAREPGDDSTGGWLTLYDAWHCSPAGLQGAGPGLRHRAADQAKFVGALEERAVEAMVKFLRHDLKVRALILTRLPETVDRAVCEAPVQFARQSADVVGMTAACSAAGEIDVAHGTGSFTNRTVIEQPEAAPFHIVRPVNQPFLLTSVGWPPPNLYRAEGPWLAAVLGGVTGCSGVIWDDVAGAFGDDEPESPGTAAIFGSFPACAALFRGGMAKAAPPAIAQTIDPADRWSLEATSRESPQPAERLAAGAGPMDDFDPLVFLTGPVTRTWAAHQPGERRANLAGAIDRSLHIIRSLTGELVWDAGHGIVKLDTPRAQGAAGFLSRVPSVSLSRFTVYGENDYAAVLAVALDAAPLDTARRILVQVITTDRPTGFRASGQVDGEIQSPGASPWLLEPVRARVTLTGGGWSGATVRAVDARGLPLDEQPKPVVSADGDALTFPLAPAGLYHLVSR